MKNIFLTRLYFENHNYAEKIQIISKTSFYTDCFLLLLILVLK